MKAPLYYQSYGKGKPIVLIHGWTMDSRVWNPFVEEFLNQYNVVTLDLRGHGNSSSLPGPYDFKAFAEDILGLIEHLSLEHITLIGWSMGVSVILAMLEKQIPEVDSLVFISGTPSLTAREDYPCGLPRGEVHRLFRQVKKDYQTGMKNFYNLVFQGKDLSSGHSDGVKSLVCDISRIPPQTVALESLHCLQDEDLRPSLSTIRVPTLLIHGALDRICMPAAAQYMAEHITGASLLMIEETGHAPFLIEKEKVHSAIRKFIRSTSTTG